MSLLLQIPIICPDILRSIYPYLRRYARWSYLNSFSSQCFFFIFDSTILFYCHGRCLSAYANIIKCHKLCPTWVSWLSLILVCTEMYEYEKWGFRISPQYVLSHGISYNYRVFIKGAGFKMLQIDSANKSSFAKTIQLFINPDACSNEMRLQNGQTYNIKFYLALTQPSFFNFCRFST